MFIDMRGANWVTDNHYAARQDAIRFEDWEIPYALMFGAKAAMEYAMGIGLERIESRNHQLAEKLRQQLRSIGLPPLDQGKKLSSIITVYHSSWKAESLMEYLHERKINASISAGDFALIDFKKKGVPWALRLSPHYYNTDAEIERVVEVLKNH